MCIKWLTIQLDQRGTRGHHAGMDHLSIARLTIAGATHSISDNFRDRVQQIWETILHGKIWLDKLEETGAQLHTQIMKLDKEIAELQLEVAYLDYGKELPKETNVAGSPTLLQAFTLLASLWLHPKE